MGSSGSADDTRETLARMLRDFNRGELDPEDVRQLDEALKARLGEAKAAPDDRATRRVRLTDAGARKLPYLGERSPSGAWPRCLYYDDRHPGLAVRCFPHGTRRWVLIRKIAKRQHLITLGDPQRMGRQSAIDEARKKGAELAQGRDPGLEVKKAREVAEVERKRLAAGKTTLRKLVGAWLEWIEKNRRPSTVRNYRLAADRYILPALGDTALGELSREDVVELHAGIEAPYMANRVVAALSSAWSWGARRPKAYPACAARALNPCRLKREDGLHAEEARARIVDEGDQRRIGEALQKLVTSSGWTAGRRALVFYLLTGWRPSEVCALRWDEIHDRRVLLPTSKTGQSERLLPPAAAALLAQWRKDIDGPWVFPSPVLVGEPLRDFRAAWSAVRRHAGIPATRYEAGRHTFANALLDRDFGESHVADALGHRSTAMARVYVKRRAERAREGVDQVGEAVAEALGLARPRQHPDRAAAEMAGGKEENDDPES